MKKLVKCFLSFLMMISLVVPFAYINATELSVRKCASTDTNTCPRLVDGEGDTVLLYYPRVVEVIGTEGIWSKIKFNHWGYTFEGYVYTEYLDQYQTYT